MSAAGPAAGSKGLPDILIVAKSNTYGLTRDAELLAMAIARDGGDARIADLKGRGWLERFSGRKRARRVIHLERAHPAWFGAATDETLLIPNQERFPRRQIGRLKRIDRVLAKTGHAAGIFSGLGVKAEHFGFLSEDRYDAGVEKDWSRFFHLAGGSTLKGTEDVLALWSAHPEWPELVLVQKAANAPAHVPANVRLLSGYLDDAELKRLQNACGIHLCPSRSEGWGHHLVEAMSCGAVVVTTDGAPMNEHVDAQSGVLVAAARSEPRHLGTNVFVDPAALEQAIETLIAMAPQEKQVLGKRARARYETAMAGFRERLRLFLAG